MILRGVIAGAGRRRGGGGGGGLSSGLLAKLVSGYKFSSGARLVDSIGSATLSEVGSPTDETGIDGGGLGTNGIADNVNDSAFSESTALSVSLWIKYPAAAIPGSGTSFRQILTGVTSGYFGVNLLAAGDGSHTVNHRVNNSNSFAAATTLAADVWNHVVIIYDFTTPRRIAYINGTKIVDASMAASMSHGALTLLNNWVGHSDEIYVARQVLSGADVAELYNAGAGNFIL